MQMSTFKRGETKIKKPLPRKYAHRRLQKEGFVDLLVCICPVLTLWKSLTQTNHKSRQRESLLQRLERNLTIHNAD